LRPGTPAVLGGELSVTPVPLPITAHTPDKRSFVIDEASAEAERAVPAARGVAEDSRRRHERAEQEWTAAREADDKAGAALAANVSPPEAAARARGEAVAAVERLERAQLAAEDAREDRMVAEADLAAAEARRAALRSVLDVERLE